jgi:hypothetical protein
MRKRRIAGSRSAAWRLFVRHGISFKKKSAGGGKIDRAVENLFLATEP